MYHSEFNGYRAGYYGSDGYMVSSMPDNGFRRKATTFRERDGLIQT